LTLSVILFGEISDVVKKLVKSIHKSHVENNALNSDGSGATVA